MTRYRQGLLALLAAMLTMLLAGCGGDSGDASAVPDLPPITATELIGQIEATNGPVVVNVWASWCIPCRSEAPLLDAAADRFASDVTFIGLNVRDTQAGARGFIAEFFPQAAITHVFDAPGNVPLDLGASRAVPITIFYRSDGTVSSTHTGVLDERTLALGIDEIVATG